MRNFLLVCLLAITGCTNEIVASRGAFSGDILTMSQHFIGLKVSTATTANPYPEIYLGSGTSTIQFMPVGTNIAYAPNYAITIDDTQEGWNPFKFEGYYGLGSGTEATYEASQVTNTVMSQPVIPK